MDTSISAINSVTNSSANTQKTQDKNNEQIKELAQKYDFDHFDTDNDGKLSGSELSELKRVFNSVSFDTDDDGAVDETSFNDALSEYQE